MDDRLNQALRTLRAIQQRYETGSNVESGYIRSYTVQMALGYADMLWIAAAIEALVGVAKYKTARPTTNPNGTRNL